MPPAASTFAPSGSKQPTRQTSDGDQPRTAGGVALLPNESQPISLVNRAKKMGIKMSAAGSKPGSRKSSDVGQRNFQPRNDAAASSAQPDKGGTLNDLIVDILRCSNVYGQDATLPPALFCMYQFYKSPEYSTQVIVGSNNPEFNDQRSFSVRVDSDLDKYLRVASLDVLVYEQNEISGRMHVGTAKIPLAELARDKDIIGSYDIRKVRFYIFLFI